MTAAPDDLDAPDLPEDPAAYARRPRGLGMGFWAMIFLCLASVVAGVAFARYGPVLFPVARLAPTHVTPVPSPEVQALNARIAELQSQLAEARATRPEVPAAPSAADLDGLDARVERLEAGQRRVYEAAAAAIAGAALADASRASQPFADALSQAGAALPDSPDLRSLRALAETGAPSRSRLATQFPPVAARAAVAARAPVGDDSFLARAAHALASIVVVRRTDKLTGDGPDAVLARAQQRLDEGDVAGALTALDRLDAAGKQAIAPWRIQAERRLEIDRHVAGVRNQALARLTAVSPGAAP